MLFYLWTYGYIQILIIKTTTIQCVSMNVKQMDNQKARA